MGALAGPVALEDGRTYHAITSCVRLRLEKAVVRTEKISKALGREPCPVCWNDEGYKVG